MRIFTSLHRCRLGAKNLDFLVLGIKNLPDDPTTRFDDKASLVDLNMFGEVEEDILDVIDFEFPNKVDDLGMYPRLGNVSMILPLFYSWCTCYLRFSPSCE